MLNTKAAIAALWCCVALALPARATTTNPTLSLQQAFTLTLARHPDMRRLPFQQAGLVAEAEVAAQKPAWLAGASLENALGTGDYRGIEDAELTLSLGSVLEPQVRRDARVGIVRSRLAGLDVEAEARRLDLLAEVARRYLDVLSLQEDARALQDMVTQRRNAAVAARRRVTAGASPSAVQLGAEAAVARVELELERTRAATQAANRRLALMWGGDPVESVAGNLLILPVTPDFAPLASLLERTPELRRFAGEARLREARLQLAQSQGRPDMEWQVGLRRLEGSNDWALIGGLSVPLGSQRRAEPAIRAARAELDQLALEREAGELGLRATLVEAHGRLQVDALTVRQTTDAILPRLERAERAAGNAYRAGALSYLEWPPLQAELLAARRERLAAAPDHHRALVGIQRLTAEPFVLAARTPNETTP